MFTVPGGLFCCGLLVSAGPVGLSGGRITGLALGLTGDRDGLAGCVGLVSVSDGRSGAVLWSSPRTGVLPAGMLGLQACGVPC